MADFYAVLGVERTCSDDELKKAYRKLAMENHPDRNGGSKEAEERFKEISEAYDVLRDPQKRAAFDRYGEAGLRGGGGAGFHHVDLSEALGIFMRDFGGFGGLEELFGQRAGGQSSGPRAGDDIKINVRMTLAEVATGVERKIPAKLLDPCDHCEGSGAEPGSKSQTCNTCGGVGEVRRAQRSFFGQFVTVAPCPTCHGEGRLIQSPCKKCRGEGRLRGDHEVKVQIPAGVATGQYMTLRGVGNAGTRGGPRGDIHVLFEVADDPRFERNGEDLYTEVLVTYPQLALGSELSVPVVSGHASLNMPAGTQSGHVFHMRGKGLPRVNSNGMGDLHVRIQLWTPDRMTEEEKTLLSRLAEIQPGVPQDDGRGKGFWSKMKEALGA
ncbi:MAG TPA: molecular chaperone DnaJ [Gemmatimonadaceae bacterium]|jgi:molecular chaperone DnaJ